MAEDPKANAGEKCEKKNEKLRDKFKEVMGEPSTELLVPQNGSAPEGSRNLRDVGETLVELR